MDALREWMGSDLDVITVGTWMLCGNGWSLIWTLSCLAHALREWMESDLDVIMVGTWTLCSWKTQKHRVPRGFRHVKYEEVREMPRIPDFSLYTKQFLRARTA